MTFLDLAKKRCSIRKYAEKRIGKEEIDYLLEAARMAPSACNYQPWFFLVVESPEGKEQLQACYPREWFKSAPLYIVVFGDHRQSWKRSIDGKDHLDIDAAIAIEHICLAAAEKGLGTCWVCHFDAVRCAQAFQAPEGVEAIAILPVGYPEEPDLFDRTPKRRKEIGEIVRYDSF